MKNVVYNFSRKRSIKYIIIISLLSFLVLPIFRKNNKNISLFSLLNDKLLESNYTEIVENIEIESSDYIDREPGSWHIDKSAEWTSTTSARVHFDVSSILKSNNKYKDIILILDVSGSMEGDKLEKVKNDTTELIEYVLSDQNNNVALITYDTDSEIITEFTNDKDLLISKINALTEMQDTNYNAPLKNVDQIMKNYIKRDNREVISLFLTDGYPNRDLPNQKVTYKLLKSKYPYMVINGIQYEMGKDVKKELKEVSDSQWIVDIQSLHNVLFEASINPLAYEKFEVVDYIDKDYFALNSIDNIKVSKGSVKLEEENGLQKIVWTLDNSLTGFSATMDIDLSLKEQYVGVDGFYPTNEKEDVTYKLDEGIKIVKSDNTPVLKSGYNVKYESNTPEGCNISDRVETHYVYEKVQLDSNSLECEGYLFKGWSIITDVKKINDDVFVMPDKDVVVRGIWSKQSIKKSMDGTIHVSNDLYNVVKKDSDKGYGAYKYTGEVTDTYDNKGNKSIYYYKNNNINNNVLFGGYCWQIIRTTATGGIKMIYNGYPTSGKCTKTGTSRQLGTKSEFNINYKSPVYISYMYNKAYEYKIGVPKTNSLAGNSVTYSGSTYTLVDQKTNIDDTHHYTCNNTYGSCSTVRYYFGWNNYIELTKGKKIEEALFDDMLKSDSSNSISSTIKTSLDNWFQSNMNRYTDYLEDTVFCNDRTITNYEESGWNPNGNLISEALNFSPYERQSADLKCVNETDRYSTSNPRAKLNYPVGLISMDEVLLTKSTAKTIGDDTFLDIGTYYWTISPGKFDPLNGNAEPYRMYTSGYMFPFYTYNKGGVRPVISLKPHTVYTEGDGSKDTPYIISTN